MLWQLDGGRQVFPVPGGPRRNGKPLVRGRTWRTFSLRSSRAGAVDDGADECRKPGPQSRWEEDLCPRLAAPGAIGTLLCEIEAVRTVPGGNLSDGTGLLS